MNTLKNILGTMGMGGWKTWLAVAGMGLLGLADLAGGDVEAALTKITAALGLLGLGQKIEKTGK